jgi:hypothetical protein
VPANPGHPSQLIGGPRSRPVSNSLHPDVSIHKNEGPEVTTGMIKLQQRGVERAGNTLERLGDKQSINTRDRYTKTASATAAATDN